MSGSQSPAPLVPKALRQSDLDILQGLISHGFDSSATLQSTYAQIKALAQRIVNAPAPAPTIRAVPDTQYQNRAEAAETEATTLRRTVEDLRTELQTVQQETEASNDAIAEKTRLITLLSRLDPAAAAAEGGTQPNKIPDPPIFSDSKEEFEGWLLQMRIKLRSDARRFPTATSRISYVISRVAGRAQDLFKGYVTDDGDNFGTLNDAADALQILQHAFGDPDPVGTARSKLEKLRQGKHDFTWFVSQFDTLTNRLQWDERAKRDALINGISDEIKEKLFFQLAPPDETYAQLCPLPAH